MHLLHRPGLLARGPIGRSYLRGGECEEEEEEERWGGGGGGGGGGVAVGGRGEEEEACDYAHVRVS